MLAQHLSPPTRSELLQRSIDLIVGIPMAVVAIPVIALTWIVVRLTSTGPGFYSQLRVGRNGRNYRLYKIRTMHHNCEAVSGAAWSSKGDARVTRVGRILRKLHIDELPQLLNVLRGEMSLVGPRPERPEFVGLLSEVIPGYTERLAVRPGVTGLAQIQLPPDTEIESVRNKLVLDRCYIHKSGLWLDLRILMGTGIYLLGFSFSAVREAMRLPNPLTSAMADDTREHMVLGPLTVNIERERVESTRPLPVGGSPIPCSETQ